MNQQTEQFKCLPVSRLAQDSTYSRAYSHQRNLVTMDSSALEVMTDLHFVSAIHILSGSSILWASQQMISQGVRMLLVVGDQEEHVIGLLTSRDFDLTSMSPDTQVDSVMTPYDEIEVISMDEVLYAVVGDIVETLKRSKRQHALSAEEVPLTGKNVIRGIFSATQISRQLGIPVESDDLEHTFEDIDRAVSQGKLEN